MAKKPNTSKSMHVDNQGNNREPEHMEKGFRASNQVTQTYGSPASKGGYIGTGPVPGAGELTPRGPGPAAGRVSSGYAKSRFEQENAPKSTPGGMKTYRAQ